MKKKIFFTVAGVFLCSVSYAQTLGGYFYGNDAQPSGWEWQSPDSLAYNKLQPHAWFFNFADVETAVRVLPNNSDYVKDLNGKWRFHWVKQPSERPADFYNTDFDDSSWAEEWVPMCWNTAGRKSDGTWKYGRPIYSNQRVIFQHTWPKMDDWRGGVMRPAPKDWLVSEFPNEVGSYRRTFTIPKDWKGREVYINFDGVDSFFYLWINGRYVGFAKNSRSLAEFCITQYLNSGSDNVVAVEVYRNSDGSFLESQDMFRLPGIIRNVYLTAKPKVQVSDLVAIPAFEKNNLKDAVLNITATVQNLTKKPVDVSLRYSLYEVEVYGDRTKLLENVSATTPFTPSVAGKALTLKTQLRAGNAVRPWTAEEPQRYVLVGEMLDKKGNVIETFSTYTGFRCGEIRQVSAAEDEFGKAGRYYLLNGKPIKMKGVNRHETNPLSGHRIDRYQMLNEVLLMKRGNINHVRNSHYPDDPYWYYLCDKYGIMLEDEANIESHEYYYGRESLSHVAAFRNMHVARNMEMVHAHVNHPSILIWSLGNEAGPGENFQAAYDAIKAFDTSRPVQYERDTNSKIVDFYSNQYPSVASVQQACQGTMNIKYPMHISEYAHSMGNAVGNLIDYWQAIESSNYCMGGAIWDWVDQAIYAVKNEKYLTPKEKERIRNGYTRSYYYGYGGDFRDKPNDGMFCMNGIMRPDLTAKAQYYEVKKVYQNVGVSLADPKTATIEIFNKNYFKDLSDYNVYWNLWKNGEVVKGAKPNVIDESLNSYTNGKYYRRLYDVINHGSLAIIQERLKVEGAENIGPRERRKFRLDINTAELDPSAEYFIEVQFCLAEDMPWSKEGYVQMEEQLLLQSPEKKEEKFVAVNNDQERIKYVPGDNTFTFVGKDFSVSFSQQTGAMTSLVRNGKEMIAEGSGLVLDPFRAPTDNDNWAMNAWVQAGLDRLKHRAIAFETTALSDGRYFMYFTIESKAEHPAQLVYSNRDRNPEDVYKVVEDTSKPQDFKLTQHVVYTIFPDGRIEMQSAVTSNNSGLEMPRIGYSVMLDKNLNEFSYYGRGPVNNYNDRKTGQFVEVHKQAVGRDIMLPKPQAMGNREEIRWATLTASDGSGLQFMPTVNSTLTDKSVPVTFSASALPYTQQELMTAAHSYQLPDSRGTVLHLDAKVTGLGGNSCGQGGPLNHDRVRASGLLFGFNINSVQPQPTAFTMREGASHPILATRDRLGKVTLQTEAKGTIVYSINGGKEQTYTAPFNFREGGKLNVRIFSKREEMPTADQLFSYDYEFDKINTVPLEVIYTSSFEPGEGEGSHFADGDVNTIWHTQYGVTLAKYPHWVDFDAAQEENMNGFIYTPRTDGPNGYVKDYEIYVSQDNKTWTKIHSGTFQRDGRPQRVIFQSPVRARYIRFYALNEQGGAEYASGAEFSLITE